MKLTLFQSFVHETTGSRGQIATAAGSGQVSFELVLVGGEVLQSAGFQPPQSCWPGCPGGLGILSTPRASFWVRVPPRSPSTPSGLTAEYCQVPKLPISAVAARLSCSQPSWFEQSNISLAQVCGSHLTQL